MNICDSPHFERIFKNYNGTWAGEVNDLWKSYKELREKYAKLREAVAPVLECEGDLKAAHVPHPVMHGIREAMDD